MAAGNHGSVLEGSCHRRKGLREASGIQEASVGSWAAGGRECRLHVDEMGPWMRPPRKAKEQQDQLGWPA